MAEKKTEQVKPGSNKLVLILIIVIVLLLGAVAAGAAWYFLANDESSAVAAEQSGGSVARKEAIYVKVRTMGGKPGFIANFDDPNYRHRFVQIYVEALTRDADVQSALDKHMPMIVHSLSTLFSKQSFTDLQTTAGKKRLRDEATRVVQGILQEEIGRPGVEAVFFTNFVMQ
ncbi:MAG TPA: flagellar basal body-associated FliL family protein [Motiliproteus sp.]